MHFNTKCDVYKYVDSLQSDLSTEQIWQIKIRDMPCRIKWNSGSERIMFDRREYYRDAKLYCRIQDIDTKDGIKHNDRKYEIVSKINPDNQNWFLILELKENPDANF